LAIIRGIIIIQYKFPIIANIDNMQAFWGLAPFATKWRKGAFWGLAPFAFAQR
jgi:predicted cobalt transporter CbtA